jgi:hypothetical protein
VRYFTGQVDPTFKVLLGLGNGCGGFGERLRQFDDLLVDEPRIDLTRSSPNLLIL